MASSSESPLPYPELQPLGSSDNQGPAITVLTAFCMTVMLIFFIVRLWIRYPLGSLFSYDDWTTTSATVVATVQAALIMLAVRDGLGQKAENLSPEIVDLISKIVFACSVLYVLALCLGKLAVVLLLSRISASSRQKLTLRVLAGTVVAWGCVSVIAIALLQDGRRPWDIKSFASHSTLVRWIVIEVVGLIFDALILCFITYLVWSLQMSPQVKLSVMAGFLVRVPLFAITMLRLYYMSQATSSPDSPTFSATLPTILSEIEMQFNIISATVPCLRMFLKHFNSGYLGGIGLHAPDDYHSRSGTVIKSNVSGRHEDTGMVVRIRRSIELQVMDRRDGRKGLGMGRTDHNDAASYKSTHVLWDPVAHANE